MNKKSEESSYTFLLQEGFKIAYEHRPELAPTEKILLTYREDGDWAAYETRFRPLLSERSAQDAGRDILARYNAPCLLCAEPTTECCHRRLVAEHWAQRMPDLTIIHL